MTSSSSEASIYIEALAVQRVREIASTVIARERGAVYPAEVWNDYESVPATPDATLLADGDAAGVVALRKSRALTQVVGAPETRLEIGAAPAELEKVIIATESGNAAPVLQTPPAPATGYAPVLQDSAGAIFAQTDAEWIVDGINHVVEFPTGYPEGSAPPYTLTFFQYTGPTGGGGITDGGLATAGLVDAGGLVCSEAASAPGAVAAGRGLYWVRDDTPCVPVFTDDAGTDHVLNAAGGGGVWEYSAVGGDLRPSAADAGYNEATNSWVFGNQSLEAIGYDNSRVLFDKPIGAFRAVTTTAANMLALGLFRGAYGADSATFGKDCIAGGAQAGVASGLENRARAPQSCIAGGEDNEVVLSGSHATISGGKSNTATGAYSAVCGGESNLAAGSHSWAGGQSSAIAPTHNNAFVWSGGLAIASTAANETSFGTPGGFRVLGGGHGGLSAITYSAGDIFFDATTVKVTNTLAATNIDCANVTATGLADTSGLICDENAAAPGAVAAGRGLYWVRNDTPCVPVFTDDAGADHILNAGGGGGGAWEYSGTLLRPNAADPGYDLANNDWVFGSQSTEYTDAANAARVFFDKSKGAFRAGSAADTSWDDSDRGTASVAFGQNNRATTNYTGVLCGENNRAQGISSGIIAGRNHTVLGQRCGILCGDTNYVYAGGSAAAVLYGANCFVGGAISCVGGNSIVSNAEHAFIIGRSITNTQSQVFVWSDQHGLGAAQLTASKSFTVGCAGGAKFYTDAGRSTGAALAAGASAWGAVCDRDAKENFRPFEGVLARVEALPIYEYNYKGQDPEQVCRGPVAQDWHEAFPSKKDPLRIDTMDLDGVALAAIKELAAQTRELAAEVAALKDVASQVGPLRARVEELERALAAGALPEPARES